MNRWHSGQSRKFSRGHHGRTYLDENGRCEMCVLEREAEQEARRGSEEFGTDRLENKGENRG